MDMNYSCLTTIFRSILTQIYVFLVLYTFFFILTLKSSQTKIVNIFFFLPEIYTFGPPAKRHLNDIDFELKKVLLPPLGNFADISYLKENFKPHLLRDVCTLCSGALVSDSLLHMLL